jgi:DNA-binding NtrC family response regulator
VGASELVNVDVRFIAATNRDLQALAGEGKFREDLLFRLNVFPIHIPPLRRRREDIPLLANHFLSKFSARLHHRVEGFTPDAMEALVQYDWPGNVRELSNVVERLVILCTGSQIGQRHLHESMAVSPVAGAVPQTAEELNELKKKLRDQAVVDVEKAFLLDALRRGGYNVTKAADQAGMQRTHFQALLRKHGLRIRDLVSGGE